ncbi:glycosyltransferase family 4 protein [Spirosoma agri]|uniref:Glycosyltransferase family 4 protein n=1 Tax=Spirosoma agri TaxID=1987381 RepID=A0A6M0INA0_9BACT|nr:glycosyltransferase family 4 protein [Spirosoma agri]NEU69574.1 glycosyltransferase family 4 protein [Spirosoma agri]
MRILLVSSATPTSKTGVTAHYNRLIANLTGRVDSVQLLTPADTPPWLKLWLGAGRRLAKWLGPNSRILYLEFENFVSVWALVRLKGPKAFDLVHAQDATTGAAASLGLSRKVRVVTTCHFNDDPVAEHRDQSPLSDRTNRRLSSWYRYMFRQQDAFINVSDYTKQKAALLHPEQAISTVIHNGVVFPPVTPKVDTDSMIIMNVGTLEERKNQRLLIEAANELRNRGFTNFQVWLLGEGPKRDEWQALVQELKLESHVSFLGFQPNVTDFLQRVSLYVHTARNESWGYAITEAIAAGTPVLAMNAGGIPEQFDEQKAGLLSVLTTAADLADEIMRYQEPAARRQLARNQWEYAYDRFRLDIMIDKHLAFYQTMINPQAPAYKPEPEQLINS